LLVLSARTGPVLEGMTRRLVEDLKQSSDLNLADAAYTLQVGRRAFQHRRFVVCSNLDDAVAGLQTPTSKRVFSGKQKEQDKPVVFMFPGQGPQHVWMGFDLYNSISIFRKHVDDC